MGIMVHSLLWAMQDNYISTVCSLLKLDFEVTREKKV